MSLGSDGATMTMPVVPAGTAYNAGNNGFGGFGDNGAWWIIILFLFVFCGWGNGWGGNSGGQGGYDTRSDIQRGFDNQAVITKLDGITQGICDSTYALNGTMTNGFSQAELSRANQQAALMQQLFAMQMQAQNCCCENREAIAQVRYDMATEGCATRNTIQNTTRDIIDNQNSGFRAILDKMCQQEMAAKDAKIAEQAAEIQAYKQNTVFDARIDAATAEILRRSGHDCPSAAYIVQPPTPVTFPTNCCGQASYGNGWGNNCGQCA